MIEARADCFRPFGYSSEIMKASIFGVRFVDSSLGAFNHGMFKGH